VYTITIHKIESSEYIPKNPSNVNRLVPGPTCFE
jgi:hypothetical protein